MAFEQPKERRCELERVFAFHFVAHEPKNGWVTFKKEGKEKEGRDLGNVDQI